MAATNPFKVSDLIAKYGWKVMPFLSNLGVRSLAEAQVLFVDSGHTNALDADDTEHGHSFEKPLATIEYAIGLCSTTSEGAIILAAPGHNEGLDSATIDFDVAGVTCIGLGEGTLRPRIDFDSTDAGVDIGANNVTLINLTFLPSTSAVLIGVDVEDSVKNFKMIDCEFLEGEDASDADEFVVCVDLKTGNNDTVIKGNTFRSQPLAEHCTTGIMLTAASERVRIEDNVAVGKFSTAFIDDGAACPNIYIANNTMKVKDGEPGIELTATTTGIIKNNLIESTGAIIDHMIVAAGCSWFNNYGVNADGEAAELIGIGEVADDSETPGAGNVYYVDNDNGDNGYDGLSWATAKADIDHVIGSSNGVVTNYDTVYVRGTGTYTETVSTGTVTGVKVIGVGKGAINPLWTSGDNAQVALTINGQGWEISNFLFHGGSKTASMIVVTVAGSGSVIKDCYFHGGTSSLAAVEYTGGSLQNKLIDNFITQFGATHGDSGNNYEAAVWGNIYSQSACDYQIIGNTFSDNTDHLKLQAVNCLIKGNNFIHDGYNDDATVVIDLYCSAIEGSNGNNIVVNNIFSHDSSELTVANGYKFRDNDLISGNYCPDGDSAGRPAGQAKTYYVDSDSGVDTNSGRSWGRAKLTIAAVVNLLVADGDTVYIRGVTAFSEAVTSKDGIDNVKIIGVSGSKRGPQWASDATGTPALKIDGEKNWEIYNMRFQAFTASTVACLHVIDGRGLIVDNCYFHGGGNAHSAICLDGSAPQSVIRNSHFMEFYTISHGNSGNNYEATIWGTNYTQSAVHVDLINNNFVDNVDHVKLQAVGCRIIDNTFTKASLLQDATIVLDLLCSGSSHGGNTVSGNTFDNTSADLTVANGYLFGTDDAIAGNFCLDGIYPKTGPEKNSFYVDGVDGNVLNSGLSWGQAKATIQQGLNLVTSRNSTVYVRGTTYTESVTLPAYSCGQLIGVCNANQVPLWTSNSTEESHLVMGAGSWEVSGFRFYGTTNTVAFVAIPKAGGSAVIRDCWFSGNGAESGIEAVSPSGAATDIQILRNRFSGFTTTDTLDGAICGTNYDDSAAVCWEIIGNMFSDNTKNINLHALSCRIEGNTFTTTASADTPTVIISTRAGGGVGGAGGGNAVVGNYFPDVINDIKIANGYLGSTNDTWAGNYATDGITTGGTPVT